ncbi:MAG: hypothetical protein WC444_06220 [Candidatus Paceibacterota bacterium]
MKPDLNDPMSVAIASATLVLHNAFSRSMNTTFEQEFVYVPMQFPVGFAETLSSLMETDQEIGPIVVTSILVAGLESIINDFNLRNKDSRVALREAITKHANEARKAQNADLH